MIRKKYEDWMKKHMEITEFKVEDKKDMVREYGSGYGRTRDRQEKWRRNAMRRKTDNKLIIIKNNIHLRIITLINLIIMR